VHGAFQSAAVWSAVKWKLESAGHPVTAVNLPGRNGIAPAAEKVTLQTYRECVLAAVRARADPVILVGHSFGGITISNAAEAAPEMIRSLIYVAAYLPRSGDSARTLAAEDTASRFTEENFVVAADRRTASVLRNDCAMLFGEDLEPAAQSSLAELLVAEPLLPIRTPVILTAARFGRVDKIYVRTLRDNTINIAQQDKMVARVGVRKVHTLDSSHSPYLSRPDALAALLLSEGAG
jgi:pimeloyl-ACP methyl ester carboxylesterase